MCPEFVSRGASFFVMMMLARSARKVFPQSRTLASIKTSRPLFPLTSSMQAVLEPLQSMMRDVRPWKISD